MCNYLSPPLFVIITDRRVFSISHLRRVLSIVFLYFAFLSLVFLVVLETNFLYFGISWRGSSSIAYLLSKKNVRLRWVCRCICKCKCKSIIIIVFVFARWIPWHRKNICIWSEWFNMSVKLGILRIFKLDVESDPGKVWNWKADVCLSARLRKSKRPAPYLGDGRAYRVCLSGVNPMNDPP